MSLELQLQTWPHSSEHLRWHLVLNLRQPEVVSMHSLSFPLYCKSLCLIYKNHTKPRFCYLLKAGCISHFLPSLYLCAKSPSPAFSTDTVVTETVTFSGSGRLMQTHSLTSRLCGHFRLGYLPAEGMFSLSGDQSEHQQHPQAAHSHEYPKHHKFHQPKCALLITEMFSTAAKNPPYRYRCTCKQLLGSGAFWVVGSSGPAMCEWPFFQEASSSF